MSQSAAIPTPREGVVFRRVPDGAVLYASDTEIYFGLNAVGAEIWELLPSSAGSSSMDALVAEIARRHPDEDPATIRGDVIDLIADLQAQGLVTTRPADTAPSAPPQS